MPVPSRMNSGFVTMAGPSAARHASSMSSAGPPRGSVDRTTIVWSGPRSRADRRPPRGRVVVSAPSAPGGVDTATNEKEASGGGTIAHL